MSKAIANTCDHTRQRLATIVVLFLAAGLVALMSLKASGQAPKYDVMKLNPAVEEAANLKKMKDAAKRISGTRDQAFPLANVAEYYFRVYVPAKITQPDATAEITPLMNDVMLRLSSAQRSNAPFARSIAGWVYRGLKPVAQGNYRPAARISAILAISRIDEAPAQYSSGTPPTPLRYMLADFLPIYEDQNNPDGVRAAALQGMHRYVTYAAPSVRGENLTNLKTLMNDLLTSEPPAGRSDKAHAYLQRFAVDILSSLRGKSDPALGQQLISISTEVRKPDLIALHSAARLGEMGADLKDNVKAPDKILAQWTVRAMRAFQYEAIRLKALTRPKQVSPQPPKPRSVVRKATEASRATGGPAADGGDTDEAAYAAQMAAQDEYYEDSEAEDGADAYSEMMAAMGLGGVQSKARPQPPEVFASRRKLNFVLQQLHLGATGSIQAEVPSEPGGLLGGVAEDQKAVVQAWVTAMGDVLTGLNDESLDDRQKYIEALEAQVEILRGLAGAAADQADEIALDIPNVSPVVAAAKASGEEEETVGVESDQPVVNDEGIPQLPAKDELSFD